MWGFSGLVTGSRLAEAQNKSQKQNKTHQEKKWSVAFILSIKEVRFGKNVKIIVKLLDEKGDLLF